MILYEDIYLPSAINSMRASLKICLRTIAETIVMVGTVISNHKQTHECWPLLCSHQSSFNTLKYIYVLYKLGAVNQLKWAFPFIEKKPQEHSLTRSWASRHLSAISAREALCPYLSIQVLYGASSFNNSWSWTMAHLNESNSCCLNCDSYRQKNKPNIFKIWKGRTKFNDHAPSIWYLLSARLCLASLTSSRHYLPKGRFGQALLLTLRPKGPSRRSVVFRRGALGQWEL